MNFNIDLFKTMGGGDDAITQTLDNTKTNNECVKFICHRMDRSDMESDYRMYQDITGV